MKSTTQGTDMPRLGRQPDVWDGAACKQAFKGAAMNSPWTLAYASCNEDALSAEAIELEGRVPAAVRGTFYRNGPARHERGTQRYGHRWDGDGMVHAIHFDPVAGVSHKGRFVQTSKYTSETAAGRFLVSAFGTHVPGTPPVPDNIDSVGVANISVCMAGPDLLALWEPGSAYRLDPSTLDTRGIKVWSSELAGRPFSAHPKREPDGTLWNFGANPLTGQLTIYCIDRAGALQRSKTLQVEDLPSLHDFAVTRHHLVFPLPPILVNPDRLKSGASFAQACEWRPSLGTRVLIVSKADWSTRWCELPPSCIFHLANAWEDLSGVIRLQMMAASDPMSFLAGWSTMQGVYRHRRGALMTLVTIDPRAAPVQTIAQELEGEFPVVDSNVVGRENREVLCLGRSPSRSGGIPGYDEVLMFGVDSGVGQRFVYGDDYMVEEHVFVPNSDDASNSAEWVVGTALDLRRKRTVVSLFCAKSIANGPVARALLPFALPLGLHGCYVPSSG